MIKLGGSLMPYAKKLLFALLSEMENTGFQTDGGLQEQIAIVPGGGVFADTVREVYDKYHDSHECHRSCKSDDGCGLTQEAAHNMAILAMEQYGHFLSGISGIPLCDSVNDGCKLPIHIILPAQMLSEKCEENCGEDAGMPHTWDTTSDAIATWIAHRYNALMIKATDVDGIMHNGHVLEHISARELMEWDTSCIDTVTPAMLLRHHLDCVVVNGRYPERVIDAIRYAGNAHHSSRIGDVGGTLIHWKDNV
ncbi:MAG: amino acid kinase [Planctomycetes bacterium]|nr:amino acid kinase [Planctomycetota bacterium]